MIISYADQINLINVSSKLLRNFCQYVFHHQIHSLVMNIRSDQLQLPKHCFISLATSLKSLTFINDCINDITSMDKNIDCYLNELYRFKQLTDLNIHGYYSLYGRLAKITKYVPPTLVILRLICSTFLSMSDTEAASYAHLTPIRLRNLKALVIASAHGKYLSYLSTQSVNLNREELWSTMVRNNLTKNKISICLTSTTIEFDEEAVNNMLNTVFDNLYRILPAIDEEKHGPMRQLLKYYREHMLRSGCDGDYRKKITIHRHSTLHYRYVACIFRKQRRSCNTADPISMLLQLKDDVLYIPRSRRTNGVIIKLLNNSNIRSLKRLQNYTTARSTKYYFQNSFNIFELAQIVGQFFDDVIKISVIS